MTERFDDASTTPDDTIPDQTLLPEPPERPARPVLVELASAILIVGGITAIVGWLGSRAAGAAVPADAGLPPVLVLGLSLVVVATGVAIRRGVYWRICLNLVALAVFVYVIALPSLIAVLYVALYTVALYALIHHRAWFEWKAPIKSDAP